MNGSEQLFAEVGEGNLEWPEILQACEEAGIEWYLIEQDVCQRGADGMPRHKSEEFRRHGLALRQHTHLVADPVRQNHSL